MSQPNIRRVPILLAAMVPPPTSTTFFPVKSKNSGNLGGPSTQPAVRYRNDAVFLARTR